MFIRHFAKLFSVNSAFIAPSCARFSMQTKITVIPGDGVGPALINSVKSCFQALGVPVEFEELYVSESSSQLSEPIENVIESVKRNKVALKGNIRSSQGIVSGEMETLNMKMRKSLDLFANVVWIKSVPGIITRHDALDMVIIREQIEGEYSCLEHESVPGVVESLKIITRVNSERIARFAFDFATKHGRKKVTAVHKANIMKLSDGLFLQCCKEVSQEYPGIQFNDVIIDACCMQLVSKPHVFDVMVMPNLYGNIVDNLASGLVGGAGIVPGESHGPGCTFFETGARHPYAEAVGKDIANPTAMIWSAANMLNFIGLSSYYNKLRNALLTVLKDGKVKTRDLGGYATTHEFTKEVIANFS